MFTIYFFFSLLITCLFQGKEGNELKIVSTSKCNSLSLCFMKNAEREGYIFCYFNFSSHSFAHMGSIGIVIHTNALKLQYTKCRVHII